MCIRDREISAEKTKPMTNNTSGINTEIKVNGQKLETVTSFKYLGSVTTDVLPCHIHLHVVNHGPLQQNSKEKYKPWK